MESQGLYIAYYENSILTYSGSSKVELFCKYKTTDCILRLGISSD